MQNSKLKIAAVCSCNMNRSMATHKLLQENGFNVWSFGTAERIRMAGPSKTVYEFGSTTYKQIYEDLVIIDRTWYSQCGILGMLKRNHRIKPKPEKFQLSREKFDLIIAASKLVYDQIIAHLLKSTEENEVPVHILNMEIPDHFADAASGACRSLKLVEILAKSDDLESEIDELLDKFEDQTQFKIPHFTAIY